MIHVACLCGPTARLDHRDEKAAALPGLALFTGISRAQRPWLVFPERLHLLDDQRPHRHPLRLQLEPQFLL